MPRKPRFYVPGVAVHVVQRGNNRQAVYFDEQDYRHYLGWLKEGADRYGCAVHGYVLMTNHVHLLVTPCERESLVRMVQYLGRCYVMYVNHAYGRSGTLWEGRYKGSLVSEDEYLLACYRYIEMNPLRAGMVSTPDEYPWSSHRANALGMEDVVVKPHKRYLALGRTPAERQAAYMGLFKTCVEPKNMEAIRKALQTGMPLGGEKFKAEIEAVLRNKVGHSSRGRPKRALTP